MKIYIASSWKNQHAVELLTAELRKYGHEVLSFVENNHGEGLNVKVGNVIKELGFDEWVWSDKGTQSFKYDTDGATKCDLVVYISPSGKDAAAEIGAAWAKGIPILGLIAKGEDFGLMRRMISHWYEHYSELLETVNELAGNLTSTPLHQ